MRRRGYPAEFGRRVVESAESGRWVEELADDLGASRRTIYTWRKQARSDAGREAGLTTAERGALAPAGPRAALRPPLRASRSADRVRRGIGRRWSRARGARDARSDTLGRLGGAGGRQTDEGEEYQRAHGRAILRPWAWPPIRPRRR